ncbi:8121_t:CDS:2, partial [Entrophospora sp. SA101]
TLIGHQVTVELKNDLAITGILSSVDQFLNIKLDNIRVIDDAKYPHMRFSLLLYERLEKELAKAEKALERNIEKF